MIASFYRNSFFQFFRARAKCKGLTVGQHGWENAARGWAANEVLAAFNGENVVEIDLRAGVCHA